MTRRTDHPAHIETPPSVPATDEHLADAIAVANVPTLACLLVHLTGDRRWIEGDFRPTRTRGLEDNDTGGLPAGVQQEIRDAARSALLAWFGGQKPALPNPPDSLLAEMMSVSLGENIPPDYAAMIRHELGLPSNASSRPSSGAVTSSESPEYGTPMRALIIGAGISGLCAAIELAAEGIPFTIVERNGHVGGVWHENHYPGAAVDVPSHLYSFSFAPGDWQRFFAGRDEIYDYLEKVTDEHRVRPHIRFGTEVTTAHWDEESTEWHVDVSTRSGEREILRANILISAVGAFNKPNYPDVSGRDRFQGPSVHTARWPDEDIDLTGKRVVVIGNGASAMQVVPAIADDVAQLTVIQRTPQWAAPFPKFREPVPERLQWLLREVPLYRRWYRLRLSWAFNDKTYPALQKDPAWDDPERSVNALNDAHRRGLTAYIESELGEHRELLPEVLPTYPPFGKRMLLDNGWFRTLVRDNVQLVTGAVTEVQEDRLLTSAGTEHKADVLIWATGFDVVNFLAPMRIFGTGGRELHNDWHGDDARAFLGTTVPGYPNMFCLYGPNTQFGHGGSLITVVERQIHYVMSLLREMRSRGLRAVDVRREVYDEYNRLVDETHEGMVWTHPGMDTYYRNSRGRVVVNNPFKIIDYWRMTEHANIEDFVTLAATEEATT